MTRYIAPKAIISHPGVLECDDGHSDSEYKHDVFLKEGWHFRSGRMAGCRGGRFHTVRDFLEANPTQGIRL